MEHWEIPKTEFSSFKYESKSKENIFCWTKDSFSLINFETHMHFAIKMDSTAILNL